jgi:hypothetical protein
MSDDVTGSPLQVEDRSKAAAVEAVIWERPRPRLGVAVLAAVATFLVIGVPTDIVPNPVFGREVPVRPWEPYVLVLTSVLTGLWFGLQRARATSPEQEDSSVPTLSAAGLALFAVACPVCNKIVLIALGTSGALGFWEPLQPWLAGISLVALLGSVLYAARKRPCAEGVCSV